MTPTRYNLVAARPLPIEFERSLQEVDSLGEVGEGPDKVRATVLIGGMFGASAGVHAILAQFVASLVSREVAPARPQTVPGSRGVEVGGVRVT